MIGQKCSGSIFYFREERLKDLEASPSSKSALSFNLNTYCPLLGSSCITYFFIPKSSQMTACVLLLTIELLSNYTKYDVIKSTLEHNLDNIQEGLDTSKYQN